MFRSKREAAAWLGGIVDGEGTILHHGGIREVTIVNTDESLLAGVYEACDQLGYAHRVYERSERRRYGKRRIWEVHISQRDTLERFAREVVLRSVKAERVQRMVASYPARPPRERAVALYQSGLNLREVAEKLKIPQSNVQLWVSEAGASRESASARCLPVPPDDRLRDVYERTGSLSGVAREFGCSVGTASRWIVRAGLRKPVGRPRGAKWSAEEREHRGKN